ncbi:putative reverse transcriptase zinc-binding domain-containing protein [Helianthus annuus]|nr:putative reverse transcriptase zinc-binding domain-containing protein [Helianthus annuus]
MNFILAMVPTKVEEMVDISRAIKGEVRGGAEVAFWVGVWAAPEPLMTKFPLLFQLEKDRWCSVAERARVGVNGTSWGWEWRRNLANNAELRELQQLSTLLQGFSVTTGTDRWVWELDPSRRFSVGSIKKLINQNNCERPDYIVQWNSWVPMKVGVVAWRAEKERLPTRDALFKRGISIQNLECILCGEYNKTCEHLFVSCGYAQMVWQIVYQWCKMQPVIAFCIKDILDAHYQFGGSMKRKKAFHVVCLVTIWRIWSMRNELMFSGNRKSVTNIVEEIKSKSYQWVKHRAKESNMTWEQWRRFDVF